MLVVGKMEPPHTPSLLFQCWLKADFPVTWRQHEVTESRGWGWGVERGALEGAEGRAHLSFVADQALLPFCWLTVDPHFRATSVAC